MRLVTSAYPTENQWRENRWWRQNIPLVGFLLCWLSIRSRQSPVMWIWFLTELSVIQIRGRWKERTMEAQRVMPGGWLKGSCAQGDSPTNTQIYWKCKEGGASLKSHGTLGPITGQWLYGWLCIMKITSNKIRSYHTDWVDTVLITKLIWNQT